MTNFENRLFVGVLFAGQLFRRRRGTVPPQGPDERHGSSRGERRFEQDLDMFDLAIALVMSGALDH